MIKIKDGEIEYKLNTNNNYEKYKYDDIEFLISEYKNKKLNFLDVITYTLNYLEETKNLNYIIFQEKLMPNLIELQIQKLKNLQISLDNKTLFELYPLFGVPLIVKDNMDVENLVTTAGSKYFENNLANKNCKAVEKLVKLGAIVVGKSNLSEASGMSAQHGYSELGNKTINPLNSDYDTSGSSSGSAVCSRLGFPLTLGSETFGSIIFPSTCCGVYGWKPEQNLLTDKNVIPISFHYDCVGIITNSTKNLNYISKCLKIESKIVNQKLKVKIDYSKFLLYQGLNFWLKDEKKFFKILDNIKQVLEENNYEVEITKSPVIKSILLLKNINKVYSSCWKEDFEIWNKHNKSNYDLQKYLDYALKLDQHFDVFKTTKNLDVNKRQKIIENSHLFYDKYYSNCDVVIGSPFLGTFVSSLSQNPALSVPLGFENNTIEALGICATSSSILLNINNLINQNLEKVIKI